MIYPVGPMVVGQVAGYPNLSAVVAIILCQYDQGAEQTELEDAQPLYQGGEGLMLFVFLSVEASNTRIPSGKKLQTHQGILL